MLQAASHTAKGQIVPPPGPIPTVCAGNVVTSYGAYGAPLTCGSPAASGVVNSGTANFLGVYRWNILKGAD